MRAFEHFAALFASAQRLFNGVSGSQSFAREYPRQALDKTRAPSRRFGIVSSINHV
jgi:hypothetical protein